MKAFTDSILSRLSEIGNSQNNQLERFSGQIIELTKTNEGKLDKVRETMNEGIRALQGDANLNSKQSRDEISDSLKRLQDSLLSRMAEVCNVQKNQFDAFSQNLTTLTQTNDKMLEKLRGTVEERLASLQEDNGKKLEQMRATVDEKLHATLAQRLGQSFQLVSERLELVHKGLGEMETVASGVGDL
jgi:DNA recombination protein RmuC